jgi:hypothetical protein
MPARKPRLFVGSSSEARIAASSVQQELDRDAEVTVWNQNVFEPSRSNLESLENALSNFDFAAFLLTPDDVTRIRNREQLTARDNVVFESGLFMGKLGRDRVFLVQPRGVTDLHLPTDLAGITVLDYEPNRSDQNMTAALGNACHQIRLRMRAWNSPPSNSQPSVLIGINPHYDSDLALLDGNFQLNKLLNPETILVITGIGLISELLDRPTAALLREKIDQLGKDRPNRRSIIISDEKWLSDPFLNSFPAISIGGATANSATKAIIEGSNDKSRWNNPGGLYGAYWKRNNVPLVALWGDTALRTRQAVAHYFVKGLLDFLSQCWK